MYFILLILIGIGTVIYAIIASQFQRATSVMSLVSTAIRYELPLPEVIAAQATEIKWSHGRKMRELADLLREGASLPVAIDSYGELFPVEGRLAIRVGGESGTLQECLESTTESLSEPRVFGLFGYYYNLIYIVMIVNALILTTAFLMYFIIPKYKEIFNSFGVELPALSVLLISIVDLIVGSPVLFVILIAVQVLLTLWLLIPLAGLLQFLMKHNRLRPYLTIVFGPLEFLRNQASRCFPLRATPVILRFLAVAARTGKPLQGTLISMERHYADADIRRRLAKVNRAIEQGGELWDCLARGRFLNRAQAASLQAAASNRQLPFALQELSRTLMSNREYRFEIALEWGRFLVIMALVCWVGFVAISMFLPLVNLIGAL
ncbi:MAG: type II secretion system F family protein [Planctomycetaceae bacterium]|nr:type II secretion system F family protein [Planctomycetaceae bacterium]